ncbi:MAG TPA: MFS transporter [Gaiellaceae bacterium]|nr:MFS transporter [Gaiellaceae bacterium]
MRTVTGGRRRARIGLLREAEGFRLLFFATLASSIGTWLAFVALVVDVFDRTQNASWVSALLVVEFLPSVVVGFLAGRLLDVTSRRWILVLADVARAGVFFVLPFASSAFQIVALALVAGIATSLFRPAVYAGLPNLVSDDDLPQANGLLQTADNFTWAVGALVGGGLVAATSPDVAYLVNAVSFIVSALLIVRIRQSLEEAERAPSRGHWRDLAEGFSFALRSKSLLTIIVAWSIAIFATAGVNVAEIFLAKDVFSSGDFGYGLLVAAGAFGLMIGSLFGGSWIEQRGMAVPYGVSIGLMALGFGAAAAAPNVWVAAVVVVAAGAGNGVAVVTNAVLVQRGAPDRLRGRSFAVVMSLGYAFLGLGMIVAGPLTNEVGARAVWAASAVLLGVAAVVGFVLARKVDAEGGRARVTRATGPEPAPD